MITSLKYLLQLHYAGKKRGYVVFYHEYRIVRR